jgi:hypothetical protein
MYVEIRPEPSAAERQAILEALRSEQKETSPFSRWQGAGLELDDDAVHATAPPRQSLGATRA